MADSSTSRSESKDQAPSISPSPASPQASAVFASEWVSSPTGSEASLSPPPRSPRSPRIRFGASRTTHDEAVDGKAPLVPSTMSPPPTLDGPVGGPPPSSKPGAQATNTASTTSPLAPSPLRSTIQTANMTVTDSSGIQSHTTSTVTSPPTSSAMVSPPAVSSFKPSTPPGASTSSAPASPPPAPPVPSPYTVSPIDSATSHRVIRTIVHNAYAAEQAEAEALAKRLRTYFVATDLSEEGAHALEWTIGSFLRDGDTLLAIYAVEAGEGEGKGKKDKDKDKDKGENKLPGSPPSSGRSSATPGNGTPGTATPGTATPGTGTETPTGLPIGSGGVAMLDAQDTIRKLNSREEGAVLRKRARSRSASASSRNTTPSRPPLSKAENLRYHAIRLLTQICTRALAKTDIKVQVAIEVIHCRSPKHMITEAIDTLEPTLVILGSRGRGALKGVLLGSFSNYLVTKSSVPVLVARKHSSALTSKPTPQVPAKEAQRPTPHPHSHSHPHSHPHLLGRHAVNKEDGVTNKLVTARVD